MAGPASDAGIEVCLFVGPREGFDIGAHAWSADGRGARRPSRAAPAGLRARGYPAGRRGGIRSFLVADLGLLAA